MLRFGLAILAMQAQQPLPWLVGTWCTEPRGGKQSCERWTAMRDGVMVGTSQIRRDGVVTPQETMRISVRKGRLAFHAEPRGQAPADFTNPGRYAGPFEVIFENKAHDYPQRIRYWREGEMLMAEISLIDGTKPSRWAYRRVGD